MGSKDKAGKLFMACHDVFAELINVLVFEGAKVLEEEYLLPGPTESIYPAKDDGLSSQFQDCSMYDMREGNPCALYTLENQGKVDRAMALRCAGYEGAAYRRQYRPGGGQGIYPVVSVVLNWGEEPWEAATSIRELLGYSIPACAEDYLDKNRMHVFDMRYLGQAIRERFEGDIRVVLDYLSDRGSLIRRRQKLRNPEEVLRMLHALSDDARYLDFIEYMKEEGGRNVCDLFESMVNKGLQQGLQQGLQEGKQQGLQEGKIQGLQEGKIQGLQEGKIQGLQEGKQQGLLEGIQKGLQVLITTYKEFGITYEAAAAGIKEKYGLDDEEVQRDMKLYW